MTFIEELNMFTSLTEGLAALQSQFGALEGASLFIPLNAKQSLVSKEELDLHQEVMNFLVETQQSHNTLLLLGEGGSGKSLYVNELHTQLWQSYTPGAPIPLLITLPHLEKPASHAVEEALLGLGFNSTQINELKEKNQFIFILDGYDELYQLENIIQGNHLEQWNAKTLITCRSQYLYHISSYERYFTPMREGIEQASLLKQLFIAPFNEEKIALYIQRYEHTIGVSIARRLASMHGLNQLLSKPYLLSLAVEVLPELCTRYESLPPEERQTLTQMTLYDLFMDQWFQRQQDKLKKSGHIEADIDMKPQFWAYCRDLSVAMHEEGIICVSYQPKGRLFASESNRWDQFFSDDLQISLLRSACPIHVLSKRYFGFIHSSYINYFTTRAMYEEELRIEPHDSHAVASVAQPLPVIARKSFTRDVGKVESLRDSILENKKMRQKMHQYIDLSKTDERYAIAAANAITGLNAAGENFSSMDLSHITIPDADLSSAFMYQVDLVGSNLSGVNFQNAMLVDAKLSQSNLKNTRFLSGESFVLSQSEVTTMVVHPQHPDIAVYAELDEMVVVRLSDGVIIKQFGRDRLFAAETYHYQLALSMGGFPDDGLLERERRKYFITSLAFNSEGVLASGKSNGDIHLWDSTCEYTELTKLKGHESRVNSLAFGPEGLLASGGQDGTICLWDPKQKYTLLKTLAGHATSITTLAFSLDGTLASTSFGDNIIRLWFSKDEYAFLKTKTLEGHEAFISCLTFGPNDLLASGSRDHTIRLWDSQHEYTLLTVLEGSTPVARVAFGSDGLLASGGRDGTIHLWDPESGYMHLKTLVGHLNIVSYISFNSDGMLVSGSLDRTIRLWDSKHKYADIKKLERHAFEVTSLAFGPDGLLASGSQDGIICLWDSKHKYTYLKTLTGHKTLVSSLAFSSNGTLASASSNTIRIWDSTHEYVYLKTLEGHTSDIHCLAFGPNDLLASIEEKGAIRLWASDNEYAYFNTLKGDSSNTHCLAFGSDNFLAASGKGSTISVWDHENESIEPNHVLGQDIVTYVTFSPNGLLASGGTDCAIHLWDLEINKHLTALTGFTSAITQIVFSSDDLWLIGASLKEILIWHLCSLMTTPYRLPMGAQYFSLYKNSLAIAHAQDVYVLNFADFARKFDWIITARPSKSWLQNCDVTDTKGILLPMQQLIKDEGAISSFLDQAMTPKKSSGMLSLSIQDDSGNHVHASVPKGQGIIQLSGPQNQDMQQSDFQYPGYKTNKKAKKKGLESCIEKANVILQSISAQNGDCFDIDVLLSHLDAIRETQGKISKTHVRNCCRLALDIRRHQYGRKTNHPDIALSLKNLGILCLEQRNLSVSQEYLQQALAMQQVLCETDAHRSDIANTLFNLGTACKLQENFFVARDYFQQSLTMRRALYGEEIDHKDIASLLFNLGIVYDKEHNLLEAREYYQQALVMQRTLCGENPDQLIFVLLNNLGMVCDTQGDFSAARDYFKQALAMQRALYGERNQHPQLVTILRNLAWVCLAQENFSEAQSYYQQELIIQYAINGEDADDPDIAVSLDNLGSVYKSQGDFVTAKNYYQQALLMRHAIYGEDTNHSDIATSLGCLGTILMSQNDFPGARNYFQRALMMQRALNGQGAHHPDIAASLNNLASVCKAQSDFSVARNYFQQTLIMQHGLYGKDTNRSDIAETLKNLGEIHEKENDSLSACDYFMQELAMRYELLSKVTEDNNIAKVLSKLTTVYLKLKKLTNEDQSLQLASMRQDRPNELGVNNPDIVNLLVRFGTLAIQQNKFSQAEEYFTAALTMMGVLGYENDNSLVVTAKESLQVAISFNQSTQEEGALEKNSCIISCCLFISCFPCIISYWTYKSLSNCRSGFFRTPVENTQPRNSTESLSLDISSIGLTHVAAESSRSGNPQEAATNTPTLSLMMQR